MEFIYVFYESNDNIMNLYNALYDEKFIDLEEITVNTFTDEDGMESGIFTRFRRAL